MFDSGRSATGLALSVPLSPNTSVLRAEFVATFAMCLPCLVPESPDAAPHIFPLGYGLQVTEANAQLHSAKMVDNESFRDRPIEQFPPNAMGHNPRSRGPLNLAKRAISIPGLRSSPKPAGIRKLYSAPEPLLQRPILMRHRGFSRGVVRQGVSASLPLSIVLNYESV